MQTLQKQNEANAEGIWKTRAANAEYTIKQLMAQLTDTKLGPDSPTGVVQQAMGIQESFTVAVTEAEEERQRRTDMRLAQLWVSEAVMREVVKGVEEELHRSCVREQEQEACWKWELQQANAERERRERELGELEAE